MRDGVQLEAFPVVPFATDGARLLNAQRVYSSSNQWGIPDLGADDFDVADMVAFHDNRALAAAGPDAVVHFFLDDYRFERVWSRPVQSAVRLARVGCALTPDFSTFRWMPPAMQVWQRYRAMWCGRYWQELGVRVLPTLAWADADSYEWSFAGVPRHCPVAVSASGVRGADMAWFQAGLWAALERLEPSRLLVYGRPGSWADDVDVPVTWFETWNRRRHPREAKAV